MLFPARLCSSLVAHLGHLKLQCTPTYWGLPGWCLVRLSAGQGHVPQSCVCGPHNLGGLQMRSWSRGPASSGRAPAPRAKLAPAAAWGPHYRDNQV